jgi:hypothetical protein
METIEVIVKYPGLLTQKLRRENKQFPILQILENVFAEWNGGSGQECPEFMASNCYSMSSGNFVCISGEWFKCMSIGWKRVTALEVQEFEHKVINSPFYFNGNGAWRAVQEANAGESMRGDLGDLE